MRERCESFVVRHSDWADRDFADERDCGVIGIERDICRIDIPYAPANSYAEA